MKVYPTPSVRYLSVILDQSLSFDNHVIKICHSLFIFLRSLYRVRSFLSPSCVLSFVDTFVFSCIDYCNSILSFCNCKTINRFQRVPNCFARLVEKLPCRAPTSDVINNLGWLRVNERVVFKICCLAHKCIHGSVPLYVSDLISFPQSANLHFSLRSHSSCTLHIPMSKRPVCETLSPFLYVVKPVIVYLSAS